MLLMVIFNDVLVAIAHTDATKHAGGFLNYMYVYRQNNIIIIHAWSVLNRQHDWAWKSVQALGIQLVVANLCM